MAKKAVEIKNDNSFREKASPPKKNADVERALIENFVALQKVMTNLSMSFDNLSGRISKLLDLFEMSAKALAEKSDLQGDGETNNKLDNLLQQNRILAKGIAMLHENNQNSGDHSEEPRESPQPLTPRKTDGDNYQRSIYSKP